MDETRCAGFRKPTGRENLSGKSTQASRYTFLGILFWDHLMQRLY